MCGWGVSIRPRAWGGDHGGTTGVGGGWVVGWVAGWQEDVKSKRVFCVCGGWVRERLK